MRVLVLTSPVDTAGRPDTADTFQQADEIACCLRALGHDTITLAYGAVPGFFGPFDEFDPHLVFNLVEDLPEGPDQLHSVTRLLDRRNIAFTGATTEPLRILGNKLEMKARLRAAGLPVPGALGDTGVGRWIVKSAREHASLGLTSENVVTDAGAAFLLIATRAASYGGEWFAEEYIEGREFNVAVLDGEVLPIAEILFTRHAAGVPRIVGYAEKWETASEAYLSTPRVFPPEEQPLFGDLRRLARAAWELFALSGYARVDFRVDRQSRPFILEVNANPCLAADAGFCAAAAQRGLSQADVVARLLEAARPDQI